jgi:Holliday junction resolvasome RuvABC endonuclease subunit
LYIDPGLAALGWALYKRDEPEPLFGQIRTYARQGDFPWRIRKIRHAFKSILEEHQVETICIENYTVRMEPKSVKGAPTLGTIGMVIGLADEYSIPLVLAEYSSWWAKWTNLCLLTEGAVQEMVKDYREHEGDAARILLTVHYRDITEHRVLTTAGGTHE